jgi:hypothetical protein
VEGNEGSLNVWGDGAKSRGVDKGTGDGSGPKDLMTIKMVGRASPHQVRVDTRLKRDEAVWSMEKYVMKT